LILWVNPPDGPLCIGWDPPLTRSYPKPGVEKAQGIIAHPSALLGASIL